MVSVATERIDAEPSTAAALTVVVAEPLPERLVEVSEELTRRGFVVIPATSWSATLAVMAAHPVHIAVVHQALAVISSLVEGESGHAESADRSSARRDVPFIFTVDAAATFDWPNYALLDSADYVAGPVSTADLGRRVSALASRLARRARANLKAEQLRTAIRRVSEAIQSTNEPSAMGAILVSGVADVFDLPYVSFTTFDETRVPRLGLQCQHGHPLPTPLDLGDDDASVQDLASRLWRAGAAVDPVGQTPHASPDSYPELIQAGVGDHVSLALPLGNGTTAFGLLWVPSGSAPRHWSSMEVSLLRHLTGVAAQALMQARIIIGQHEVLKRLQRLDDAKSNFLQTVNHELRTPLTSMTAYLDLLRDGTGGELPPAAANMLTIMERNVQRLGMLVEDVLTISRMTADPQVVWDPVSIRQLVTGVVAAFSGAATARGVRLEVSQMDDDLVVAGDVTRLRQAFRNITDNAIKFTPSGGRVEISVAHCVLSGSIPAVSVRVADTGNGVTAEDLPELFTSFFRGANAEAGAVRGSGLGLAIVRGVVDSHCGTIEVSETPGGGTTISVQLPVQRQELT